MALDSRRANTKLDPAVLNGKLQAPDDLTRFFFILTAPQELLEGGRVSSTETMA
jgi:hypothetical protein